MSELRIPSSSRWRAAWAVVVLCLGCESPAAEFDFERRAPTEAPSAPADDAVLVVGVGAMLGPVETYESHAGLLEYLARRVGRRPRLVQRRTYEEMNRLLVSGEVDVAFICSGAYVPIRDRVTFLAAPIFRGAPSYRAVVLTADPSAHALGDFRAKTFAFTDPLSQTGRLYVLHRLRADLHTNARSFFERIVYSGGHDASVRMVLDGQVDAASVDEMIYAHLLEDHPDWGDRLHEVERSPPFGSPPVVARQGLPTELVDSLRRALLTARDVPEVHAYLEDMGIDGFAGDADYTLVVEVARDALSSAPVTPAAAP